MVAFVEMLLSSGVWWLRVGDRLCFPELRHLEQSSPTGNTDIHISRGSMGQGSSGHKCAVVIVAQEGSLPWGLWSLVGGSGAWDVGQRAEPSNMQPGHSPLQRQSGPRLRSAQMW